MDQPQNLNQSSKSSQSVELSVLNDAERLILIERFQSNIHALRKYAPKLAKRFESYEPQRAFDFVRNQAGSVNIYFTDTNRLFYEASDPIEYCREQVTKALETIAFKFISYNVYKMNRYVNSAQLNHRYINEIIQVSQKKYELRKDVQNLPNAQQATHKGDSLYTLANFKIAPLAFCLGVGLGYYLPMLYEQVEIINNIVIEPDNDLFYASLFCTDYATLLDFLHSQRYNLTFFVAVPLIDLFNALGGHLIKRGVTNAHFLWTLLHYSSEEMDSIAKDIQHHYNFFHNAIGFTDDYLFELSHNIHHLKEHIPYCNASLALSEDMRKHPVFVVANGPSLENDLDFIRKYQDHAIIIACGTALERLYRSGIQADIFCGVERGVSVASSVEVIPDPDYFHKLVALLADCSHPKTVSLFDEDKRFLFTTVTSSFVILMRAFMPQRAKHIEQALGYANPLVGNTGLSLALSFGFDEVYIFGMDNGSKTNEYHAQSAFYDAYQHMDFPLIETPELLLETPAENTTPTEELHKDKEETQAKVEKISVLNAAEQTKVRNKVLHAISQVATLEGNFGGKVNTNALYIASQQNAKTAVRIYTSGTERKVYNCADGAVIEGTIPLHSNDSELRAKFDKLLTSGETFDKTQLREELLAHSEYLDLTDEEIDNLLHKSDFKSIVDKILNFLHSIKQSTTRSEYMLKLQGIHDLLTYIDSTIYSFVCSMLHGSINNMLVCVLETLYFDIDEQLAIKNANEIMLRLEYFLEDVKFAYDKVPDYCMDENYKYYNGKIGLDHEFSKAPAYEQTCFNIAVERAKATLEPKFVKRYS